MVLLQAFLLEFSVQGYLQFQDYEFGVRCDLIMPIIWILGAELVCIFPLKLQSWISYFCKP